MVDLTQRKVLGALARAWKWLDLKAARPVATSGGVALAPGIWPLGGQASGYAALRSGAVWACCNIIAKAISTLPTSIYEEAEQGHVMATDHPLYRLLTYAPNPVMTFQQWMQPTMLHLLLWGNAFTYIDRLGGEIVGFWPLLPERMRMVYTTANTLEYTYFDIKGEGHKYTAPGDMIHFRLFSLDGCIGLSVLQYQALSLEFQEISQMYVSNLYRNGGRPSGVLEYPVALQKPQIDKIRQSWAEIHGGPEGAGRVAILENGAKYSSIAIPPEALQYIETQQFSIQQIARIFGVAPHLIGADDKPTYASVDQQSIEFMRYTIAPYVKGIETSLDTALLEDPYFYKFNLNAFERSDIRTRFSAYATGRQWGWLSVNDIRRLEDMNTIGPDGDQYLVPLNMEAAGTDALPPDGTTTANPPPGGALNPNPTEQRL